ncbi:hypothetical protein BVG19_g4223 [[Candida] boidinii]|nr:hypothetical protein BVG19_g4223 [[Candida] boidinii]OWB54031.1 hypothetical protein B5S27_g5654 [[Candida] boidinii]
MAYTYTFEWPSTNVNEVYVTGTFDNWNKSVKLDKLPNENKFRQTVKLPYEKTVYKFIVDGNWIVSNFDKKEFGLDGIENNVILPEDLIKLDSILNLSNNLNNNANNNISNNNTNSNTNTNNINNINDRESEFTSISYPSEQESSTNTDDFVLSLNQSEDDFINFDYNDVNSFNNGESEDIEEVNLPITDSNEVTMNDSTLDPNQRSVKFINISSSDFNNNNDESNENNKNSINNMESSIQLTINNLESSSSLKNIDSKNNSIIQIQNYKLHFSNDLINNNNNNDFSENSTINNDRETDFVITSSDDFDNNPPGLNSNDLSNRRFRYSTDDKKSSAILSRLRNFFK